MDDALAARELELVPLGLPAGLEVVPTHSDNFLTPPGQPQAFVLRVKLAEVPREVGQLARDARVAALPRIDS